MGKKHARCHRCRLPAPDEERHLGKHGLFERRDGSDRWLCLSCVLALVDEALLIESNRQLDAWVERQTKGDDSLTAILRRLGLQP